MNQKQLREYLKIVAANGYGNKESESEWEPNPDGSTTIKHKKGNWSMNDNFFGGEPYGGREVVFFQEKPVWIMVYYGEVASKVEDVGNVYSLLQEALLNPDPKTPVRGPKVFEKNGMKYEAEWNGNILQFKGNERILQHNEEVYAAQFIGGLVDKRKE